MKDTYWNHNVAYHNWIIKHIKENDKVLDVGCGEGLLLQKISNITKNITGIEPDKNSYNKAIKRNIQVINEEFENYNNTYKYDVIIFVASIHHMDFEKAILKAKSMLNQEGKIIIVGLSKNKNISDYIIELLRIIPTKIASIIYKEKTSEDIRVPTAKPNTSYKEIKNIVKKHFTNYKIKHALYYRYLLACKK